MVKFIAILRDASGDIVLIDIEATCVRKAHEIARQLETKELKLIEVKGV